MSGWARISGIVVGMLVASMVLASGVRGQAAQSSQEGVQAQAGSAKAVDFKKLKNPVPYTKKSIARGKSLYLSMCAGCHGRDGKALLDSMGDTPDLTAPKEWRFGTTDGEIFRSTRDGAGVGMPGYKFQVPREEDIWHLVNFMRSRWPESTRPRLQKETENEARNDEGREPSQKVRKGL